MSFAPASSWQSLLPLHLVDAVDTACCWQCCTEHFDVVGPSLSSAQEQFDVVGPSSFSVPYADGRTEQRCTACTAK